MQTIAQLVHQVRSSATTKLNTLCNAQWQNWRVQIVTQNQRLENISVATIKWNTKRYKLLNVVLPIGKLAHILLSYQTTHRMSNYYHFLTSLLPNLLNHLPQRLHNQLVMQQLSPIIRICKQINAILITHTRHKILRYLAEIIHQLQIIHYLNVHKLDIN